MAHTPLKFLSVFTDYWGIRAGIKNRGFWSIDEKLSSAFSKMRRKTDE